MLRLLFLASSPCCCLQYRFEIDKKRYIIGYEEVVAV